MTRAGLVAIGLLLAEPIQAAGDCEPIPNMFCVSQRVVSLFPGGEADATDRMFVYRFHDEVQVDIAYGNPPVSKTEMLECIESRTYKSLMLYSFSSDWRQGAAAFVDPGMSTVEFYNCVPED